MEFCYTAIVLKKRKVGETDRLYILYTREGGKVQAIARGVRKPRAKLAGHLETFNRGSIVVARSRGLGTITSAVADWYGEHLKSDSRALLEVARAVSVFERLVDVGERDGGLFGLLRSFLETADRMVQSGESGRAMLLAQAFLFQVLGRLGYQIEVARSAVTGESLQSGCRYVFGFDAGGIVEAELSGTLQHTIPISENAIKLLRLFRSQSLVSIVKVRTDEVFIHETRRILDGLLGWI